MWIADAAPALDPNGGGGLLISWPAASVVVLTMLGAIGVFVKWLMSRQDDLAKDLQGGHAEVVAILTKMVDDERERTERVVLALTEATGAMRANGNQITEMRALLQELRDFIRS